MSRFLLLLANVRPSGAIEGATYDDQQGGYKFPSNATIPDIEFAVGDQLYKVNPKDIAFGDAGDGYTFGGIQSRGNLDFDIFGDIFLDRKSTRLNSSHSGESRMPSSA